MRPKLSRVSNGGELRRRPDGRSRERARELRTVCLLLCASCSSPFPLQPALWLEFGVVARAGGRRDKCAGEESCKRVWEGVPLTSTALDRIVVTVLVQKPVPVPAASRGRWEDPKTKNDNQNSFYRCAERWKISRVWLTHPLLVGRQAATHGRL